jgi:hypothetical protein
MKFIMNASGELTEVNDAGEFYIGGKPEPGSFMDKMNHFSDWVVSKEIELFIKPFVEFMQGLATTFWHWFIKVLPDLMGYGAIIAGICIILSAMIGRGGLLKPLAVYFAALVIAICILTSV